MIEKIGIENTRERTLYCRECYGSGKLLGGGMMLVECHNCDGHGYVDIELDKVDKEKVKVDKESKSYKKAIRSIKKLNPSISDLEAQNLFEEEFNKIEEKEA